MSSSVTLFRGLNRGLRRYKYRCYEQVRTASNGMGCEWSHNYFRDETVARNDPVESDRRTEVGGYEDAAEYRRTGMNLWGKAGERDYEGVGGYTTFFEEAAIRDNAWHRKRSENCVNPSLDDEDWIDD